MPWHTRAKLFGGMWRSSSSGYITSCSAVSAMVQRACKKYSQIGQPPGSMEPNRLTDKEIREALNSGRTLQNVYALETQQEKTLEEAIDSALNRQTSEDDTHPSPADRFRLVANVVCRNQPGPSGLMWDLFADREAITKEMSSLIEKMVKAAVS